MTLIPNRQNKLPAEVLTWCYHCLGNTRLKTGEATYIDKSPEWLVVEPARYIERRVKCAVCIANGKSGETRFVPVDDTIPSIYAKRVAELREIWGNLSEEVRLLVAYQVLRESQGEMVCQFTLLTGSTMQQKPNHFKNLCMWECPSKTLETQHRSSASLMTAAWCLE